MSDGQRPITPSSEARNAFNPATKRRSQQVLQRELQARAGGSRVAEKSGGSTEIRSTARILQIQQQISSGHSPAQEMREGITRMSILTATFIRIAAAIESMKREEGQGLIEYSLIAVLISIVAIVAMRAVGVSVTGVFNQISTAL